MLSVSCLFDICSEIMLCIDATDYRSNFVETILFENCSCFSNTFQYLGGISKDISVFHFDSRRSLSPANRRRSTSPILFLSFTQPCDQHDRKIPTICKSAARWRGRVTKVCARRFASNIQYMLLMEKLLYCHYLSVLSLALPRPVSGNDSRGGGTGAGASGCGPRRGRHHTSGDANLSEGGGIPCLHLLSLFLRAMALMLPV